MARVLIVDDDSSVRQTLGDVLGHAGHEVVTAGNADTAEATLASTPFDVVVTDIVLPRVSGIDLLQRIRRASPGVPVIMMTGEPSVDYVSACMRAGACDFLCKPVANEDIVAALDSALEKAGRIRPRPTFRK